MAKSIECSQEQPFSIDGVEVLSEAPTYRRVFLETNIGTVVGSMFEANDNVYYISRTREEEVAKLNTVVANSRIDQINDVTSISSPRDGIFPPGSKLLTAKQFNKVDNLAGSGTSVTLAEVTDNDQVRDNGIEVGDFVAASTLSFIPSEEISATVVLNDGSSLTGVRGLRQGGAFSFGTTVVSHVFEGATLDAAQVSMNDIADVTDVVTIDHDLTWFELGFEETAIEPLLEIVPPSPTNVPNPTNPPPILAPTPTPISSAPSPTLNVIRVAGGSQTIRATSSPDFVVVGSQTGNGSREVFTIVDFDPATDFLVLEEGASIRRSRYRRGDLVLLLAGRDRDRVVIDGVPSTVENDIISVEDSFVLDPTLF